MSNRTTLATFPTTNGDVTLTHYERDGGDDVFRLDHESGFHAYGTRLRFVPWTETLGQDYDNLSIEDGGPTPTSTVEVKPHVRRRLVVELDRHDIDWSMLR